MKKLTPVLALSTLVGCTGEPEQHAGGACRDPAEHEPIEGVFATSDDFPRDGCRAGALADLDPSGLWFIEEDRMGFFRGGGPVRFETSCEAGVDVQVADFTRTSSIDDRFMSEDDLFWRLERTYNDGELVVIDAYDVCNVDEEGNLRGQAIHCWIFGEEEPDCRRSDMVIRPFTNLPDEEASEGLSLLGEFSGGEDDPWPDAFNANVRVHDRVAFLARGEDGLRAIDVRDPARPEELGHLAIGEGDNFNDIKIVESGAFVYALMASDARGMVVVDITDPTRMEEVAVRTPSGDPKHGIHTLFTEQIDASSYAYLADGFSNLVTIWDVTQPRVPEKLGEYVLDNEEWRVHDLYVEEGRMYLNATVGGLVIVDTQPDPANPTRVGQWLPEDEAVFSHSNWVTEIDGKRVSISGGEGYTAHYRVIDVEPESETFLQVLGSYQTRPQVSAHNVMADGELAIAAYYQDGVRVLDVSDPESPEEVAHFNTWSPDTGLGGRFEGAVGIDIDMMERKIYVADAPRGLLVLELE